MDASCRCRCRCQCRRARGVANDVQCESCAAEVHLNGWVDPDRLEAEALIGPRRPSRWILETALRVLKRDKDDIWNRIVQIERELAALDAATQVEYERAANDAMLNAADSIPTM